MGTVSPAIVAIALLAACGGGGGGNADGSEGPKVPPPAPQENAPFRAIAGISMGAYGALNLGTKHPDAFGVIGSLGGPVDLTQLLVDLERQGLAVKALTASPGNPEQEASFDHMPRYPGRNLTLSLVKDLMIAFGNPFLHHPDPSRQYLASDSEPAALRMDDRFGPFELPADPRGFADAGDRNGDGQRQADESPDTPSDVLLGARGSLARIAPAAQGVDVGGRALADVDGDGVYDVGDGIVVNGAEPFDDANGNGVRDSGEAFQDVGLDGVPGSGDFGEGNGGFDVDPDRARWLSEDPLTRLAARDAAAIQAQRIYMDVGTADEFGFARHYANLVSVLEGKGIPVTVQEGFSANCTSVPAPSEPFLLVRYAGGHIGIADADTIVADLLNGDVCGAATVWQRLITLVGFLNESFPDGRFGPGVDIDIDIGNLGDLTDLFEGVRVRGDLVEADVPTPSLATSPDAAVPTSQVLVYRPIEFFNDADATFPIVYLLPGYGQETSDFERIRELLDLLILTRQVQNMFVAVLPGNGGVRGTFYVNHAVPEEQVPDAIGPTSGRYEDAVVSDLVPYVEAEIARGRIRR
ncbi:MAG TPA: alpha/beta hydrolase-fold protein [Candidatus Binatia bacterium]|nr:alpha/beta hydrolase-fold protein [Candidatus Binatia bacterium]